MLQWEKAVVPDSGCHRALGARAAGAEQQRALKMVKPSHNKSFFTFPDVFSLTTRKRRSLPFFTNLLLKACHCSLHCPGWGPCPCTRPWLRGYPLSSAPLFQLDGFPARSSRRNLGFWWGNAASAGEGRGGKAMHFQCSSTPSSQASP